MKHKEDVEIPATIKSQITHITCDSCHEKMSGYGYSVDEVTITHRTGTYYPEGGEGIELGVDMCGKCFNEKLLPWFQSQGIKLRKEEWSS